MAWPPLPCWLPQVTLDVPEEFHRAAWLCLTTQERMERHLGADSVASLRLAGSHIWALLRCGTRSDDNNLGIPWMP